MAAAFAALRPKATWECSHVGGDRFAANVVALPHGLYYGRVTTTQVGDLVSAYERGRLLPALLRGRSSYSPPVQAAQQHAYAIHGEDRIDALPPVTVERLGDAAWRVRLRYGDQLHDVVVRAERAAPARLTCSAMRDATTLVYRVVEDGSTT